MHDHRRKTDLARFGETVMFEHLTKIGYECTPLGYTRCFDIEAYNASKQKFLVQVKTRNHTTSAGRHRNRNGSDRAGAA
jgi:hypothetical protein